MRNDTGQPSTASLPSKPAKQGISRRILMTWLTAVVLAEVLASGITWPTVLQRFQAVPTTPTRIIPAPVGSQKEARDLVQQYYKYINQRDYRSAYQLWGAAYQKVNTYDQFASGFANTIHDDVAFTGVTSLPDGTVAVSLQLFATDRTATGTVTHIFETNYLVGQQNRTWKLLSASAQQISTTQGQDERYKGLAGILGGRVGTVRSALDRLYPLSEASVFS